MKLWAAQCLSLVGSEVTGIALPLAAIVMLGASPWQVGLLAALGHLPFLLVSLPAGVYIDRRPRLPILVATDLGRAAVLAAIPLLYARDALTIALLYPIVFVHGALTVFFAVAHQAILPELVPRERIVEGNTQLQTSHSMAQLAGPGLGGLLVQALTAPVAIALDAASFVASAILLLLIPRAKERRGSAPTERTGMKTAIGEGLRRVLGDRLLRPIALCMAGANFFDIMGMVRPILPLLAIKELELTAVQLGTVLAVSNLGALLGAVANQRVVRWLGVGPAIVWSSLIPGIAVLLMPLANRTTGVVILALSLALAGFAASIFNINQLSLRQAITPPSLQGRMHATMRFLIWGPIPAGALLGGVLGETLGLRATLLLAGLGSVASSLPVILSPLRRLRDIGPEERPPVVRRTERAVEAVCP
jgi:predicted MFS family arabinose efflux permease